MSREHDDERSPNEGRPILVIAGAAALAMTLAIYVLRLDRVVGLVVDDAWYVLLAKALATGQGYTLINSPTPGITPFYPPGFPALLSVFYRLSPNFPDNIWLLKSVSIAAMIGVGFLSFRYFDRYRGLPTPVALTLAFATAIYPPLVFLATSSVMSECVFAFAQLAAIVSIEKSVRRDASGGTPSGAWRYAAVAGVLASFAFLTRPAGLGLLLAAVIYLLKEKLARHALVFGLIVAVLIGPWISYSRMHAPTPEQRVEQGGSIVLAYGDQFWHRVAGRPRSGTIDLGDLPTRVWENLSEIGKGDFGAFVFHSFYRPLEPGEKIRISDAAAAVSLLFALLALVGYAAAVYERVSLAEIVMPLSISISLLWGWEQYRLLLPLVPFFFFYLLMGVRWVARRARLERELVPLLVVSLLFAVSSLEGNYRYLRKKYHPRPEKRTQWIRSFEENEAFMRYVGDHVAKDETIAAHNPALVHLYTGHRTIASSDPAARWRAWKHIGVRYYAITSPYPVQLDANESRYRILHVSDGLLRLKLIDLGPPESRPASWAGPAGP